LKKYKILVFIGGSYVSGLEISTLHLINSLKSDGHDVRCVINGWNDGVFKQKLDQYGIPWYELKLGWLYITKPLWTLDTLVHWPGAFWACRKILKEFEPDICHFSSYAAVIMIYPLLKGQNCVYNLQEPHLPTKKDLFIYRLLNKRITIFTTVSKKIVGMLVDLHVPEKKIRLIYNGVPLIPEGPLKAPGRPVVFGIIGQIVPWKGHETLIDAVGYLAGSSSGEFLVCIFGNDKNEYAGKLRAKIAEKNLDRYFEWKGFVSDQAAIYSQVDVAVVPSLSEEPCSLSILESMMYGKGLIVSDRGGNPELISHEETGFIFPAGNSRALARDMLPFLQDPGLISQMGHAASRKAKDKYTDTRMKDEYLIAYDESLVEG
jgi:glycosyltransferase involved in cell wall biosynthesis